MEDINKLYILARRELDLQNAKKARFYYQKILLEDPESWEAMYFELHCSLNDDELGNEKMYAFRMKKCLEMVFEKLSEELETAEICLLGGIKSSIDIEDARENIEIIYSYAYRFAEVIFNRAREYHSIRRASFNEYTGINIIMENDRILYENQYAAVQLFYRLGDLLFKYFEMEQCTKAESAWHGGIQRHCDLIKLIDETEGKETAKEEILKYVAKIQKINPDYQTPQIKTGGCYIATAVYGSYDCPQVWTLRRFRDNYLHETNLGRLFIKVYYKISPAIVKMFGKSKLLNRIWKTFLDYFVYKLNARGVNSTPYEDKY